jgi:hypothetical protein
MTTYDLTHINNLDDNLGLELLSVKDAEQMIKRFEGWDKIKKVYVPNSYRIVIIEAIKFTVNRWHGDMIASKKDKRIMEYDLNNKCWLDPKYK